MIFICFIFKCKNRERKKCFNVFKVQKTGKFLVKFRAVEEKYIKRENEDFKI